MERRSRLAILVVTGLLLSAPGAGAANLVAGATISAFAIEDQHGESHEVNESIRAIVFSREMDGGGVVKRALAKDGREVLERAGAVYVANVSRMPGLVRRFIAEPRLRKRGYAVLLDREGELTGSFPSEDGRATLLVLDHLRIVRVEHLATPEELLAALAKL